MFPDGSPFRQRIPLVAPAADAAVHGNDVGVTHLLQVVRRQCRAKAAAAVEDDRRVVIGYALLDVAFEDALPQMNCVGQVVLGPLALLAHVNEDKALTAV